MFIRIISFLFDVTHKVTARILLLTNIRNI